MHREWNGVPQHGVYPHESGSALVVCLPGWGALFRVVWHRLHVTGVARVWLVRVGVVDVTRGGGRARFWSARAFRLSCIKHRANFGPVKKMAPGFRAAQTVEI